MFKKYLIKNNSFTQISSCTFLHKKSDKESVVKLLEKLQDGVYQTESALIFIIPETEISEHKLFKVVGTNSHGTKVFAENLAFDDAVTKYHELYRDIYYTHSLVSVVEM